jgi:hypothetical protein
MNRVEYVKDFKLGFPSERQTLFSALLSCLNAEETCAVLDITFEQGWTKRQVILRKIARDAETEFQECHHTLVHNLVKVYGELPYDKKNSCAHTLGFFCDRMPENEQDIVIKFLLASKYIGTRRAGYRKLATHWKDSFQSFVERNWKTLQDPECTWLIVDHFPVEYLETNSLALQKEVKGTRYLSRLYLRIAERTTTKLGELRQIDEITFAYVSVKLNRTLNDEDSLGIFERNKNDERLGLLIWCFGQMKLWCVLESIDSQIEGIALERVSHGSTET